MTDTTEPVNNTPADQVDTTAVKTDATQTTDAVKTDAPADAAKTPADGSTDAAKTDATKTPEVKTEEAKKEPAKKEEPAKRAPEKYEFKLAEGVKLTPEVTQKLEAYARANDLPQEAAQALVDLAPDISKMYTQQLIETARATSTNWATLSRADKEIANGGDETILKANMAIVAKARDAFASKELVALLENFDPVKNPNGTGLGNHPEVIRHFLRLGKQMSEDNKVVSGAATAAPVDAANKLYGNTSKG